MSKPENSNFIDHLLRTKEYLDHKEQLLNDLKNYVSEYMRYGSSDGKWDKREPLREDIKLILKDIEALDIEIKNMEKS